VRNANEFGLAFMHSHAQRGDSARRRRRGYAPRVDPALDV